MAWYFIWNKFSLEAIAIYNSINLSDIIISRERKKSISFLEKRRLKKVFFSIPYCFWEYHEFIKKKKIHVFLQTFVSSNSALRFTVKVLRKEVVEHSIPLKWYIHLQFYLVMVWSYSNLKISGRFIHFVRKSHNAYSPFS